MYNGKGCCDAGRDVEAGDRHVVGLLQSSVLPPLRLEPTEEWHRIAVRLTGIGLNRSAIQIRPRRLIPKLYHYPHVTYIQHIVLFCNYRPLAQKL
jgi:hypothetical protein